jgi:hypothetical protein
MTNYYRLKLMENYDFDLDDELECALYLEESVDATGEMVEGPSQ